MDRLAALAVACSAVVVVGILTSPGCYNPKIANRGFQCNKDIREPHDCPEGFACDTSTNLCVRGAVDAAVDQPTVETNPPVDAPAEQPVVEAGHEAGPEVACFVPPATCKAAAGLTCDPLCQTGCKCHEKCAVISGALACTTPFGPFGVVGDACTIATDGSDNCSPGLTCMPDGCGNRCYAYCRSDEDCPMSACNRDAGGGQKVCDVPHITCNPLSTNPATLGCPLVNDACYLSPTAVDVTLCDCPFGGNGSTIGAACKLPRECFAGLVCIDPTGGNNFQCHEVCSLSGANTCVSGGACRPLNGSAKYGFCN